MYKRNILIISALLTILTVTLSKGDTIHAFQKIFRLHWTSSSLNLNCRIETADSPGGPWNTLTTTWVTSPSNKTDTVMVDTSQFFRVAYDRPDPHLPDITEAQSFALLKHRRNDPNFIILDIRTEDEYDSGHIIGSINYDYYATSTFNAQLNALDKTKTYLIYCRTGNRSGDAHDTMRDLGFKEVYNMLGGISDFEDLAGADAYISERTGGRN